MVIRGGEGGRGEMTTSYASIGLYESSEALMCILCKQCSLIFGKNSREAKSYPPFSHISTPFQPTNFAYTRGKQQHSKGCWKV
jgi:hypothetical protein